MGRGSTQICRNGSEGIKYFASRLGTCRSIWMGAVFWSFRIHRKLVQFFSRSKMRTVKRGFVDKKGKRRVAS